MQHILINTGELLGSRRNLPARLVSKPLSRFLRIDHCNSLYNDTYHTENCAAAILERLAVTVDVQQEDLVKIPSSGPSIVVSNHPTGALDGIILIELLLRIRPDVKFLGNFLLGRIDSLSKFFIEVDPFDNPDTKLNITGIKRAIRHVASGGILVIFPAGEVATWQKALSGVTDKTWNGSVIKLIRKMSVPVTPVWIGSRNSSMFHLAGKVNPRLRTVLLGRELINKYGKTVTVRIGEPIDKQLITGMPDPGSLGKLIRLNCETMKFRGAAARTVFPARDTDAGRAKEPVVDAIPYEEIEKEIVAATPDEVILESGNLSLLLVQMRRFPKLLREVGRLREITFRQVGEGTGRSLDLDRFDTYYHHLILVDRGKKMVVGGYRLGMGEDIIDRLGIPGLYIDSLFCVDGSMSRTLKKSIELGRSFIRDEYQRKTVPLMLLWQGILRVIVSNPRYDYLIGPVTIPGTLRKESKGLIVSYLKKYYFDPSHGKLLRPREGLPGIKIFHPDVFPDEPFAPEFLSKIVCDMENMEFQLPVLIRKYLFLNSTVAGFNTDRDFNDSVDALMLLRLKDVPENIIRLLSRECTPQELDRRLQRFSQPAQQ